MLVVNSLVPVFAIMALGLVLRRTGFMTEAATQGFNRFAYFIGLPLLLFYKIGHAPIVFASANRFFWTMAGATLAGMLIMWMGAWILRVPAFSKGALLQAAFRGNLAFVGLPVVMFTFAHLPEAERVVIESAVLLAITPTIILYNLLSVAALAIYNRDSAQGLTPRKIWKNVWANPLMLGCLSGILWNLAGLTLPTPFARVCEVIAPAAFPIALIGIGGQLAQTSIRGHAVWAVWSSLVKTVCCPWAAWWIGSQLGLAGIELKILVILCAMPTAVTTYVMTDQMNGDRALAASAVVICTMLSFVSLSVILSLPI
ncbi:MAG: putative permease [Kiritimatiellia bacterium]|jgi:malate permease and related proteins